MLELNYSNQKEKMKRNLLKTKPVAKFFYKGSHSHPVRRTVLLDTVTSTHIGGYEIRCGNETFSLQDAPYRSYSRNKIAKSGDYCRIKRTRKYKNLSDSHTTLERMELVDVINNS